MIYINPSWSYRESVENIQTLKDDYERSLSSFSMFDTKKRADFIYSIRNQFYALNLKEWQIDNLWNYMNNNFPLSYLIRSASRYK